MTLPLPVTPIRFWAALWLFIFGTVPSLSRRCRLRGRAGWCRCRDHRSLRRRSFRRRGRSAGSSTLGRLAIGGPAGPCRNVLSLRLVGRCHRDEHRLALEDRGPLGDAVILDLVCELGDEVPSELRMRELPAAEPNRHLDAIAVLEELDRAMDLGF